VVPSGNVERISWLDFDFQKRQWGTIISHLAFSNHFQYHHLKQSGDYLAYAANYMDILEALSRVVRFTMHLTCRL
jgi:hypothetical protein